MYIFKELTLMCLTIMYIYIHSNIDQIGHTQVSIEDTHTEHIH